VVLLGLIGPLFVNVNGAKVGSDIPDLNAVPGTPTGHRHRRPRSARVIVVGNAPDAQYWTHRRVIGLGVGTVFGFVGGYYGGYADNLLRGPRMCFLTVPGLLILVVIASSTKAR